MIAHKGLTVPSYKQGYARGAWESLYPNLWKGLAGIWVPSMGHQGITTLRDFSGNANHGSFNGTMTNADWVIGRNGYTLDFDNTDDYIQGTSIVTAAPLTMMCWVYARTISTSADIAFSIGNPSANNAYFWLGGLTITGTPRLRAAVWNGVSFPFVNSVDTVTTNAWFHLCMVRKTSTSLDFYMNAKLQGSSTTSAAPSGVTSFRIGRLASNDAGLLWDGYVDDCRIYRRDLSANEVMQSYMGASPLTLGSSSPARLAGKSIAAATETYSGRGVGRGISRGVYR